MKRALGLALVALVAACGQPSDGPVPHIAITTTTTARANTLPDIAGTLPTTTRPVVPVRASRHAARPRPNPPTGPGPAAPTDIWARLARCESGGNPAANTGNGYYGAFQFSLPTWRSVGRTGYPHQHPYEVQLAAAQRLQARSGWNQWPTCARKLGLI